MLTVSLAQTCTLLCYYKAKLLREFPWKLNFSSSLSLDLSLSQYCKLLTYQLLTFPRGPVLCHSPDSSETWTWFMCTWLSDWCGSIQDCRLESPCNNFFMEDQTLCGLDPSLDGPASTGPMHYMSVISYYLHLINSLNT